MNCLRVKFKCLFAISILMIGCGKKPGNEQSRGEQRADPIVVEETLAKQEVICQEGEVCPHYLAKIVVFDENKIPRFCTGFLVSPNTVATSTSCLPKLLQLNGDCSLDVTFFFPQTNVRPAERMGCKKVIMVSELIGKDAVLWRDDAAYLELQQDVVSRRHLGINRVGFENKEDYTFWGIDQIDDKTAFIRRQTCQVLQGSWINPLASKDTSPNMTFSGCSLKKSSTGAPILDSRGRVRGVVSQMLSETTRKHLESTPGLLTHGLKQMFHATNFSCAPTIFDTEVEDERECTKVINDDLLTSLRKKMYGREDLMEEKRKSLEEKISNKNKFFNFSVTLIADGDFKKAEIKPKCFKNVAKWIYTIDTSRGNYSFKETLPLTGLKRTMDADGMIGAVEIETGSSTYWFQFSAKQLKANRMTNVLRWKEDSDTEATVYSNLSENCQ